MHNGSPVPSTSGKKIWLIKIARFGNFHQPKCAQPMQNGSPVPSTSGEKNWLIRIARFGDSHQPNCAQPVLNKSPVPSTSGEKIWLIRIARCNFGAKSIEKLQTRRVQDACGPKQHPGTWFPWPTEQWPTQLGSGMLCPGLGKGSQFQDSARQRRANGSHLEPRGPSTMLRWCPCGLSPSPPYIII